MAIIKKNIEKIDLSDLCPDAWVMAWVNPPLGVLEDIQTGQTAKIYEGLCKLVESWNLEVKAGKKLPVTKESFRNDIPSDLVVAIIDKISQRIASPNPKRDAP